MLYRASWLALGCVAMFAIVGCESKKTLPTVPVTGQILLDGQPLEGATVTFHPVEREGRYSANGKTDAEGKFTLTMVGVPAEEYAVPAGSGVLPGEYYVGIIKNEAENSMEGLSDDEIEEMEAAQGDNPYAEDNIKHIVPPKYNQPRRSGIKVTVTEGQTELPPIELSSQ
ncbi:MAG: hypothetical protein D6741_07465 [Planctomycetota bacterium]|nr:MAG: hypothetical protein D6741_07465 [Planctomycetota bacterium]